MYSAKLLVAVSSISKSSYNPPPKYCYILSKWWSLRNKVIDVWQYTVLGFQLVGLELIYDVEGRGKELGNKCFTFISIISHQRREWISRSDSTLEYICTINILFIKRWYRLWSVCTRQQFLSNNFLCWFIYWFFWFSFVQFSRCWRGEYIHGI